ncbi:MAG TPA: hypothetical protein VJ953_15275 [Saprospiraceae bacterium]|nr:hypothetical protein [Saprospiraceae bacterium]
MRKLVWVFLLLIGLPFSTTAQQTVYYTINIGTFVDAKADDFAALRPVGFLHAQKLEENLSQVYLGGYKAMDKARSALETVRAAGYVDAYIQERFPREGQNVAVIQITTLPQSKAINWSRYAEAGDLSVLLEDKLIKIVIGTFEDARAARGQLKEIRQKGFSDAFVKVVNSIYLHDLDAFETGNAIKKPLIPIQFEEDAPIVETAKNIPAREYSRSAYPENGTAAPSEWTRRGVETKKSPTVSLPEIRVKVKRRSALELQKVLKSEGLYTSGLDGYYGQGTKSAYQRFIDQNYDYRKYLTLAETMPKVNNANGDRLQNAINNLLNNPAGVEGYPSPLAQAYQAYVLFVQLGPDNTVNNLMNTALKAAYLDAPPQMIPGFDYRATYAYNDLTQLILHLYYIHAAPGINYTVPCWLAERHPQEVAAANANFMGRTLPMQDCNEFEDWQEINVLSAIAKDLATEPVSSEVKAKSAAARSSILLARQPLSPDLTDDLERWNTSLWQGASTWGNADPLHGRIVTTLKVAYFQAQVRLEDYFMNKDFRPAEATGLALATLRTVVGNELERFVP